MSTEAEAEAFRRYVRRGCQSIVEMAEKLGLEALRTTDGYARSNEGALNLIENGLSHIALHSLVHAIRNEHQAWGEILDDRLATIEAAPENAVNSVGVMLSFLSGYAVVQLARLGFMQMILDSPMGKKLVNPIPYDQLPPEQRVAFEMLSDSMHTGEIRSGMTEAEIDAAADRYMKRVKERLDD